GVQTCALPQVLYSAGIFNNKVAVAVSAYIQITGYVPVFGEFCRGSQFNPGSVTLSAVFADKLTNIINFTVQYQLIAVVHKIQIGSKHNITQGFFHSCLKIMKFFRLGFSIGKKVIAVGLALCMSVG